MNLCQKKAIFSLSIISFVLLSFSCRSSNTKNGLDDEISINKKNKHDDFSASGVWSQSDNWDNSGFEFLLSETKLLEGNIAGAKKHLDNLVNVDGSEYIYYKNLSLDLIVGGTERGFNQIKKSVLIYPRSSRLHSLLSKYYLLRNNVQSSISVLEKAIKLDPKVESNYVSLLGIYRSTNNNSKYESTLRNMVKAVPGSAFAHFETAKINMNLYKNMKKSLYHAERANILGGHIPEILLFYAFALEINGKSDDALWHYEKFYNLFGHSPQVVGNMLRVYSKLGNNSKMKELLNDLIKSSPKKIAHNAKVQKAYLLWSEGKIVKASEIFLEVASANPSDYRLSYMVALGLEFQGRLENSLKLYQNLSEKSFMPKQILLRKSAVLFKLGKRKEAVRLIESEVITNSVYKNPFLSVLVDFYDDVYSKQYSIRFLKKEASQNLNKKDLLFLLGERQYDVGLIESSLLTMKKILKIDSNDSEVLNFIGYTLAEQGSSLDEAKEYLIRAVKLKPNDGYYLDSLGWVLYKMKKYDESLVYLLKSTKLLPSKAVVFYHVGVVFHELHNFKQSNLYLKKSIELKLNGKDRIHAEKLLVNNRNR